MSFITQSIVNTTYAGLDQGYTSGSTLNFTYWRFAAPEAVRFVLNGLCGSFGLHPDEGMSRAWTRHAGSYRGAGRGYAGLLVMRMGII